MAVPSLNFLAFALAAAILFNIHRSITWRRVVLLIANLLFLSSFSADVVMLAPFFGFLGLGYLAYRVTRQGGARPHLFLAFLFLTIFVFFWLKRYSFIPHLAFLPFPYLLVGLSYVFFRVIHLVIDAHEGAIDEPVSWLSYLNYTLNFTSLISGPIQYYQDYRSQELKPAPLTVIVAGVAFERIALGYFKVAIVSALLSALQHNALDTLPAGTSLADRTWAGTLVVFIYPMYLYFNFSGYVDVVIGVARFFGIVLPENFDRPFSSANFIIFWSRWHMTLSNWLRTYIYNPFMRATVARAKARAFAPYLGVVGYFITFFLVGIWHGQTSEFVFFGALQGGGVATNKLYQLQMAKHLGHAGYRALCFNRWYVILCRGLTFTWFAFTLLWFWAGWAQIDRLFDALGGLGCLLVFLVALFSASTVLALLEWVRAAALTLTWSVDPGRSEPVFWSRYFRTAYVTSAVAITVAARLLLAAPAPDIVYKAF